MKEFFTADELVGLPGMPDHADWVHEMAIREGWASCYRRWYTAEQLAGLPGMPEDEQGVHAMADRDGWDFLEGDDPDLEHNSDLKYSALSLPAETQENIFGDGSDAYENGVIGAADPRLMREMCESIDELIEDGGETPAGWSRDKTVWFVHDAIIRMDRKWRIP